MKNIFIILTILTSIISISTSWRVAPWKLKIGNDIKIESIPYKMHNGGDLGITKVYKKNKLLYSIDEYFKDFVTIDESREYLISVNTRARKRWVYDNDKNEFRGEVLKIYRNGELTHSINFEDLPIYTSNMYESDIEEIYWLKKHEILQQSPIYTINDTLKILTIDEQILSINLSTGELLASRSLAENDIEEIVNTFPTRKIKVMSSKKQRKIIQRRSGRLSRLLPQLPRLKNWQTLEKALSNYLSENQSKDIIDEKVYVRRLLINRKGKCEKCTVSNDDAELEKIIEDWIYQQKFQTRFIPRYTDKYDFSGLVYLED